MNSSNGSVFIYARNRHIVLAANHVTYSRWGTTPRDFLNCSKGLYGLWTNPVDWSLQEQLVIDHGACVGLRTQFHHRNRNLIDVQVTSLGLVIDGDHYILNYVVSAANPSPIGLADESAFVDFLNLPEAGKARALLTDTSQLPENDGCLDLGAKQSVPLFQRHDVGAKTDLPDQFFKVSA